MSYNKTTWQTGDIVTAEKLNNIENGIENAGIDEWVMLSARLTLNYDIPNNDVGYLDCDGFYFIDDVDYIHAYEITNADAICLSSFDLNEDANYKKLNIVSVYVSPYADGDGEIGSAEAIIKVINNTGETFSVTGEYAYMNVLALNPILVEFNSEA